MTGDQRPKLATSPKETLYRLTKLTLIFITEKQEGVSEGASRMTAGQVTKETTEKEKPAIITRQAGSNKRWNETNGRGVSGWEGVKKKRKKKAWDMGKERIDGYFREKSQVPDPTPVESWHLAPKIKALPHGTSSQADWGSLVYSWHLRKHRSENIQPTRTRTRRSHLIGWLFR